MRQTAIFVPGVSPDTFPWDKYRIPRFLYKYFPRTDFMSSLIALLGLASEKYLKTYSSCCLRSHTLETKTKSGCSSKLILY